MSVYEQIVRELAESKPGGLFGAGNCSHCGTVLPEQVTEAPAPAGLRLPLPKLHLAGSETRCRVRRPRRRDAREVRPGIRNVPLLRQDSSGDGRKRPDDARSDHESRYVWSGPMNILKKTVADQVLGLTRQAAKAGDPVEVDLTSDFGKLIPEVAGEDLDRHVLVGRRSDGKVYRAVRRRVWRWQR
jgi:hypothetical protein